MEFGGDAVEILVMTGDTDAKKGYMPIFTRWMQKFTKKLVCNVHTITIEQLGRMNSLESLAFLCRNERFRSSYLAAGYTFFSSAIFVRFLGTPLRYLESVCIDRITIFISLMCHPFWKTVISLLMSHGDMDCVHENLLMYS